MTTIIVFFLKKPVAVHEFLSQNEAQNFLDNLNGCYTVKILKGPRPNWI